MARAQRRRPRRTWLLGSLLFVVVLAGAVTWLGIRARSAQQHLAAASTLLPQLRQAWLDGDNPSGATKLTAIQREASAAYRATHDPIWFVAAKIPGLGSPADAVRGLTGSVRDLTTVSLPALASISAAANPSTLMSGPGTVDVAKLAGIAPSLEQAASALVQEEKNVAGLPSSWLPPVSAARKRLLDVLRPASHTASTAATATRLIPPMLGAGGPRRYFLAFQNPAEARGTGGLLDAFAVLTVDQGKVSISRVGSNAQLPNIPASVPGIDPDYLARYGGQGALRLWVSSNLSPDFPEVARAWSLMWKAATGQTINGVISMDPDALAAVLKATGPVMAPGIGTVDAARVVPLVLKDQYQLLRSGEEDTAARKSVMLGIGTLAIDRLLSGDADNATLVSGLTEAATSGHLHLFSANPAEQSLLETGPLAAQVPRTAGPFAQAVVVNVAGTKLDTYLHQATTYDVNRCGADDRAVTVTVTLRNDAPQTGLPLYVTQWQERKAPAPGANRVNVQVLLARAAAVRTATLDGEPLALTAPAGELPQTLPGLSTNFLDQGEQAGRPSFGLDVDLLPGVARTLTLTVVEPPSTAAPVLPAQSMVNPPTVSADVTACR